MTGKPRRKKGETYTHYIDRVRVWEAGELGKKLDAQDCKSTMMYEPETDTILVLPPSCGTCYHWGENNQCFRYPKITVTTERHRCGEHKAK